MKYYLLNIRNKITMMRNVKLHWPRAHVGSKGIEKADDIAKVAATYDDINTFFDITNQVFREKILKYYLEKWQKK